MSSNYYILDTVDGKRKRVKRQIKQGRKPQGFVTLKIRLYPEQVEMMKQIKQNTGDLLPVNQQIRDAVTMYLCNSVHTELLST